MGQAYIVQCGGEGKGWSSNNCPDVVIHTITELASILYCVSRSLSAPGQQTGCGDEYLRVQALLYMDIGRSITTLGYT